MMYAASRLAGFDRALETYIQANVSRNLTLLESATSFRDEVCVTLPDGRCVNGRDAVLEVKKRWFSQPQWRMAARVIWSMEIGDTAIAIADVVYSDADARGLPRDKRYRQVLVFRRDLGLWKAVAEFA